ncbi:DUF1848 family protein [Candidatus Dependentiae bacterium]|nr:DUF1848 family protein [Candidatus Dependentiae bacterium]
MTKIGITERGDAGFDLSWADKLDTVDAAIVITKNPTPEFMELVEEHQDKLIVHVTITGHGGSKIEPNIPNSTKVFYQFKKIAELLGPQKTVLRIDPIIPTPSGINTAYRIYFESLYYPDHRLRVSILDNPFHVKRRFENAGLPALDYRFHESYSKRKEIISYFGDRVEICGEPGFSSIGCVSNKDLDALGLPRESITSQSYQRKDCTCLGIKTELLSNREQCPYKCVYCYWKDKKPEV